MLRLIQAWKYLRTALDAEGLRGKIVLARYYFAMLATHALRFMLRALPQSVRYRVREPRLSREVALKGETGRFLLRAGTADGWVVGRGYELGVREFLAAVLRPGQVFVDVGAHIGLYTVMAGRLLAPGGVVIAVEPSQDNFEALLKNVQQNGLTNVIPINAACWSNDCELELIPSSTATGFWHRVGPITGHGTKISAKRLDTIFQDLGLGAIDVIKIDAEGASAKVVEGASMILRRFRSVQVLFEVERPGELEGSCRTLHGLGFTVRRLFGNQYLATVTSGQ